MCQEIQATKDGPNSERRRRIAAWVGASVMPHEGKVRAWLRRAKVPADRIDDLIQEGYCNLAGLAGVDHIDRPDAYFFSLVRNLLLRQLRRSAIVPLTTIAEIETMGDGRPSPEDEVGSRRELDRVQNLAALLPERSRRIFEMRKIEGLTQREIAARMGISEGMVEYHVAQGMKAIVRALRRENDAVEAALSSEGGAS